MYISNWFVAESRRLSNTDFFFILINWHNHNTVWSNMDVFCFNNNNNNNDTNMFYRLITFTKISVIYLIINYDVINRLESTTYKICWKTPVIPGMFYLISTRPINVSGWEVKLLQMWNVSVERLACDLACCVHWLNPPPHNSTSRVSLRLTDQPTRNYGVVWFGPKVGQIGHKFDKSGTYSDQISVHLARSILKPKELFDLIFSKIDFPRIIEIALFQIIFPQFCSLIFVYWRCNMMSSPSIYFHNVFFHVWRGFFSFWD